jgi:membrane-bound lytic murein transglycosylase D
MLVASLLMLAVAAEPTAKLPLPPPPEGMRQLDRAEADRLARLAGAEIPDDPEIAAEVDAESAELEEMRALEEAELDEGAPVEVDQLSILRSLGFGNPLREQLSCRRSQTELEGIAEGPALPRITDLASFDVGLVKDQYDIPIEMQPLVAQYIQFFQGRGRKWFRNWMSRSTRYMPVMLPILQQKGLPRDTIYLAMIESGFSAHAYSWAHAAGPWQFISATGKQYRLKQDFWVDERRDPIKSTHAAASFLTTLHTELKDWRLAWAAYNTGAGRVRRLIHKHGTTDFWSLSEHKRGFAKETKHYVPKLMACALVAKHYQAFGFADDEFSFMEPLEYDEVPLTTAADLEIIARSAGVDVEEVKELNPELKRWCTPPATEKAPYLIKLPKGSAEKFTEKFAQVAPHERLAFKIHKVRRGDTLSAIASKFGSASEAIMRMNGLKSVRTLRLGTDLVIPVPSAGKSEKAVAVFERQVARARRQGYAAVRPEDEVPAGTPRIVAQGPVKTEVIGGKTRITYGVQTGDSLWAIGQKFGVSVDDIRSWNKLPKSRRSLQIGTLLYLWPAAKAASPATSAGG